MFETAQRLSGPTGVRPDGPASTDPRSDSLVAGSDRGGSETELSDGDPGVRVLTAMRDELARLDRVVSDAVRIDRIRLLEEISGAVAAAQAVQTADFVVSQRAEQAAAGVPAARVGRGISAQVGLARRMSPFQATRYTGNAIILTTELPACFAQLALGVVPQWRVLQIAQHTAWLSRPDRAAVDAELAPQLERLGNRATIDLTNTIAYRLNPRGYVERLAHAETERTVSLRPAPDCMSRLGALLPVTQGVAVYAALHAHALATVGVGGETRTRNQVMVDHLVELVTGQTVATDVPVTVNLIMTDHALFQTDTNNDGAGSEEPAHLVGGGTIPAELARRMIGDPSADTAMFLRRLYTHPETGQLASMDTRARLFTGNQRLFLLLRDQRCRTPYCDAPVRHADHIRPHQDGGATSIDNGQGLCEACNYAKQAPDWSQHINRTTPGRGKIGVGADEIVTITPTGHQYRSQPPDPPGLTVQREQPARNAQSRSIDRPRAAA